MKKVKKCFYCGVVVESRQVWYPYVCDSDECNQAAEEREREEQEDAQDAAQQDGYDRYR